MGKAAKKDKSGASLDDLYLEAFADGGDGAPAVGDEPEIVVDNVLAPDASGGDYDLGIQDRMAGDTMRGWEQKGLKASADHMTVTFWCKGGGPIDVESLADGLRRLGIVHGIDEKTLQRIADRSRDPDWRGEEVVAKGTEPGVGRRIHYCLLTLERGPAGDTRRLVDGAELDFDSLAEVFTAADLGELKDSPLVVKAVRPGTRLIEVIDNPGARPGRDVFGTVVDVIQEPLPVCGRNVRYNEKARCFEAMMHGYLLIMENIVSVQPPVWIQPDQLAAYYINFHQVGPPCHPSAKDIYNLLVLMGVHKRCINPALIKETAQRLAGGRGPKVMKVAEAVQPITGRDAEFSLNFDTEKKAGMEREDGSIDLRERNAAISVKAGQLLAVKTLATKGVSGLTLFGKLIKAPNGKDKKVGFGAGVRQVKKEDKLLFYAAMDGNVHFTNNVLTVVDVMQVKGDVDYETGNLNVNTDLEIGGSVLPGFCVRAKGAVVINGSVENGATVVAGAELVVNKGIVGENTRVVCMGDLQTGFIQDAEVLAKGDVVINSYLYNARLRSGGKVTVLKGQGKRSGKIVGGVCCATKAIVASYAGSPSSAGTVLSIQADPELNGRLKELEEQLQACNRKIAKISRTLPFDSFDADRIKAFVAGVPAAQKQSVLRLLGAFSKLIKLQKEIRHQRDQLAAKADFALRHGVVRVTSSLYQGCEIEFGRSKLVVSSDMEAVAFTYGRGKINIST